jgi:hypothetical protein
MTASDTRAVRVRTRRRVWTIAAAVVGASITAPNLVSATVTRTSARTDARAAPGSHYAAQSSGAASSPPTAEPPAAQQAIPLALVPPLPSVPIQPVSVVLPVPPLPDVSGVPPTLTASMSPIEQLPDNTVAGVPHGAAADRAASVQHPPRASNKYQRGLYGTAYIGGSEIEPSGRADRQLGFGLDLKGVGSGGTQLTGSYIRGWNPGLIRGGYQYGLHRSRLGIGFKAPSWTFTGGQLKLHDRSFQPLVTADGVLLERTQGRVIGSILAARPKYFGGDWGGRAFIGSVGLTLGPGRVSLVATDLARPGLQSLLLRRVAPAGDDSEMTEGDRDDLGALFSRENRVRSVGLDSQWQMGRGHTLRARGAWLDLVNAYGERLTGAASEATYTFNTHRGSLAGQFRQLPGSLAGVQMPADQRSVSGRFRLTPRFAVLGHMYSTGSLLFGHSVRSTAFGGSAGIQYASRGTRIDLRGNYRDADGHTHQIGRTITAAVRVPVGGLLFADGRLDLGETHSGGRSRQMRAYRAALHVDREPASLSLSTSYQDDGLRRARVRLDLSAAIEWRASTFEGGVGRGRGQLFGDTFSAWCSAEVPLPGGMRLMLGLDYDRWDFVSSPFLTFIPDPDDLAPPLRFSVNLKTNVSLPIPYFSR